MATFRVTAEELSSAARKIQQYLADYDEASNAAITSGLNLAGSWEGAAQKVFAEEQERAKEWYAQMSNIVKMYIRALEIAAKAYEAADIAVKILI